MFQICGGHRPHQSLLGLFDKMGEFYLNERPCQNPEKLLDVMIYKVLILITP